MLKIKNYFCLFTLAIVITNFPNTVFSDSHNLNEVIKLMQKDLKTLERAVYSDDFSSTELSSESSGKIDQNSEPINKSKGIKKINFNLHSKINLNLFMYHL